MVLVLALLAALFMQAAWLVRIAIRLDFTPTTELFSMKTKALRLALPRQRVTQSGAESSLMQPTRRRLSSLRATSV